MTEFCPILELKAKQRKDAQHFAFAYKTSPNIKPYPYFCLKVDGGAAAHVRKKKKRKSSDRMNIF